MEIRAFSLKEQTSLQDSVGCVVSAVLSAMPADRVRIKFYVPHGPTADVCSADVVAYQGDIPGKPIHMECDLPPTRVSTKDFVAYLAHAAEAHVLAALWGREGKQFWLDWVNGFTCQFSSSELTELRPWHHRRRK